MQPPSFMFSGLDSDTLALANELDSLGGGDATTHNLSLYTLINKNIKNSDCQILLPLSKSLGIRDTSLPRNHPSSENVKYFNTTSSFIASNNFNDAFVRSEIVNDLVDWVMRGFNGCLVPFGMRNSGKTTTLFGNLGLMLTNEVSDRTISDCFVVRLLRQIFDDSQKDCSRRTTVAISAWTLRDQHIVDLIAPVTQPGKQAMDFALVECPNLDMAHRLLNEARSRAPGVLQHVSGAKHVPEADRAHFFLRIVLHQADQQSSEDQHMVSSMYVTDLLGLVDTKDRTYESLPESERVAVRSHNLQLNSVLTVLGEMKSLSQSADQQHAHGRPALKMTSARNSKLSSVLAPILQGNVRSDIAVFLKDGEANATDSERLLNALSGATDIVSACHKVKGVSLQSLQLQQYDQVLGPYYDREPVSVGGKRTARGSLRGGAKSSGKVATQEEIWAVPESPPQDLDERETSSDYGDVNLQQVLSGDYSDRRRSTSSSVGRNFPAELSHSGSGTTTFNNSHSSHNSHSTSQIDTDADSHRIGNINSQTHCSLEMGPGSSVDVSRTMNEFHDLMEQLAHQQTGSVSDNSPVFSTLHAPKRAVSEFLRSSAGHSSGSRTRHSTAEKSLDGSAERYLAQRSHESNSPKWRQRGSNRYGGILVEDTPIDGGDTVRRGESRVGDDVDDVMTEMAAAFRALQHGASGADSALIEAQIQQLLGVDKSSGGVRQSTESSDHYENDYLYDSHDDDRQAWQNQASHQSHSSGPAKENSSRCSFSHKDTSRNRATQPSSAEDSFEEDRSLRGGWRRREEEQEEDMDRVRHSDDDLRASGGVKSDPRHDAPVKTTTDKRDSSHYETTLRIVADDDLHEADNSVGNKLHDFTKGLTSGPAGGIRSSYPSYSAIFSDKLKNLSAEHPHCIVLPTGSEEATVEARLPPDNLPEPRVYLPPPPQPQFVSAPKLSLNATTRSDLPHIPLVNHATCLSALDGDTTGINSPAHHAVERIDNSIPEKVFADEHEATAEIEKLQRANQSLMEALREEKSVRVRLEAQLMTVHDDLTEMRTQCDVQLESQKVELVSLRHQLRSLCDNYSLTDVFATFEKDVSRLERENAILRQQNLQLEMRELDMAEHPTKYSAASDNHSVSSLGLRNESLVTRNVDSEKQRLLAKLKKSGQEREALKGAFEALKTKERQVFLSNKLAQDASRRLRISHQELQRTKKDLEAERLANNEKERDLFLIRRDTQELRESEGRLKEERARTLAELSALRERVRELDDERRRAIQVGRFVAKHSDESFAAVAPFSRRVHGGNNSSSSRRNEDNTVAKSNSRQAPQHCAVSDSTPQSSLHSSLPGRQQRDKSPRQSTSPNHVRFSRVPESHSSVGSVQAVAGLSNAQYSRQEETDGASPDLEVLLAAMREGIVNTTPALLPVFRKLADQIFADKTKALEQRAKLLERVYPVQPLQQQNSSGGSSYSDRFNNSPRAKDSHPLSQGTKYYK